MIGDMPNRRALSAIILAAGFSSRMNGFKPLLSLGGQPAVVRSVTMFRDAGISDVSVVVGHRAAELRRVLAALCVRCVENPDYREGMFTSVSAGVQALPTDCRGFFVHPVDIPLVRSQTVVRVANAFRAARSPVIFPVFDGRRGHPPLIGADLAPRLLDWSGTDGLRGFLAAVDAQSVNVAVADAAIGWDMDTPADYQRLQERLQHSGVPSADECRVLMDDVVVLPARIKAHCRQVATVAKRLAAALKAAGQAVDVDAVYAAALLHDIARLEKDHPAAGAHLLVQHGFARIAPAVAAHMTLAHRAGDAIDTARIVYLADKLVSGDRVVGLTQRFSRAMHEYGSDPDAAAAIDRRLNSARRIQAEVEKITGRSLEAIIDRAGEREAENGDGEITPPA